MANLSWAKIYLDNVFVGYLKEEPGSRCCFTYDESFRTKSKTPIAINLPLTEEKHYYEQGLHPFFDNLVAEGWLAEIQAKALGISTDNRFQLLMAFGHDLVGAVTVIDPNTQYKIRIDQENYLKKITIKSKASMSGVQPKIFAYKRDGKYFPVELDRASSHIAKLKGKYPQIIENEYLCMLATKILLEDDAIADVEIDEVEGIGEALLVKRFDRDTNAKKIHFEEFASLLNLKAHYKYDASYKDLADYINTSPLCIKTDLEKLFRRILACILLGNTDAHVKNFAMYHNDSGLRLTPIYDMVFVRYYDELSSHLALSLNEDLDLPLGEIKEKHLKILCHDFQLREKVLELAVTDFSHRLEKIYNLIEQQKKINSKLRKAFMEHIKKRWNGTFKNILKK